MGRWIDNDMVSGPDMGGVEMGSPELKPVARRPSILQSPIQLSKDIINHRFLAIALVKRNLRTRYRTAGLGYTWMVLEPTLLALTYYFLFIMIAGNPDRLYPIWVLIGVIVWSTFGKSFTGSVTALTSNTQLIHTSYFPRIILPFSITLGHVVVGLGSSLVLIPAIAALHTPITPHLLWIPIGIAMAGMMGGALGTMFAPLNCKIRDVEHLTRFIVRAGFFFSPVMWTAEMALERGTFGHIALWNPMVTPITLVRHAVDGHALELPLPIVSSSICFLLVMSVVGGMVFSSSEHQAVKHL